MSIPYLSGVTVEDIRCETGTNKFTLLDEKSLRIGLSRAAAWTLASIDDRFGETTVADLPITELKAKGISADLYGKACNNLTTRIWKALLLEASQIDKLLLLERSTRYFSASNRLQETILRSEIESHSAEQAEHHTLSLEERRRKVTDALLHGERPLTALLGNDISLAAAYVVLAIRDHRSHGRLRSVTQDDWFTAKRRTTVVVLVPAAGVESDSAARAREAYDALRPQGPAGLALPGTIKEIPHAVGEAQEVVTTLDRLGWSEPTLYRLDDVLLETMLSRSRDLATRLAGKLTPVARHNPHLLDTLEAFLNSDCERRELARQLYIHPNTLAYRLKRVWELTGLSLTTASDLCLLKASLVALRMIRENDDESITPPRPADSPADATVPHPLQAGHAPGSSILHHDALWSSVPSR